MHWHPTLGPIITTVLVLLATGLMVASFFWSRRQLDPSQTGGLICIALRTAGFLLLLLIVLQPSRLPKPHLVQAKRLLAVLVDSSASMATEDRPDHRSRLEQAKRLIREHHVFEQIQDVGELAFYKFDRNAVELAPEALEQIKPVGKQTDLATAIEQTVKHHEYQELSGMLLFSDGRHTQGVSPLEAAPDLDVPVFAVGVGVMRSQTSTPAPDEVRDLSIESVSAQPRILLGRSCRAVASVRARGYETRQVSVHLMINDEILETSVVAISTQQTQRQAIFFVKPDAVGIHHYQVQIEPDVDDLNEANNLAQFTVEVVDPVHRLLYVDRLRDERRFLKPVIAANRNLLYAAVVQQDEKRILVQGNDEKMKADGADLRSDRLSQLKAIIIGDLPAEALPGPQLPALVDWVDKGGSLLLLAGPQSLGPAGFAETALGQLLPVQVRVPNVRRTGRYVEQVHQVVLTPQGAAHPAFQRSGQPWRHAAGLVSRFDVASVKPAATILFAMVDDPTAPAVVSQRWGHGKVGIVLTDSTWRWQLGFAGGSNPSPHRVFWQQMIDWLLPDLRDEEKSDGQVQLVTDRLQYDVNDPVMLMTNVRGVDGRVLSQAQVRLIITPPDHRTFERIGKLPQAVGQAQDSLFTATFDAYAEGQYEIQATAQVDGRTIGTDRAQVTAVQPLIEMTQTDPDHELLRDLAEQTGGKYLDPTMLNDLTQIVNLEPREVLIQPSADKDAQTVWDRWWLLALFVLFMGGEWLVRRKNQWV